jgi:hypothetical protein
MSLRGRGLYLDWTTAFGRKATEVVPDIGRIKSSRLQPFTVREHSFQRVMRASAVILPRLFAGCPSSTNCFDVETVEKAKAIGVGITH